MSDKLRPHHILCILHFEGKGYSIEFTENMKNVISQLASYDTEVELTTSSDIICRNCPHNIDGKCSGYKAEKYDTAVMQILNLAQGDNYNWSYLKGKAQADIIAAGKLCEVCGDCQWAEICMAKQ